MGNKIDVTTALVNTAAQISEWANKKLKNKWIWKVKR